MPTPEATFLKAARSAVPPIESAAPRLQVLNWTPSGHKTTKHINESSDYDWLPAKRDWRQVFRAREPEGTSVTAFGRLTMGRQVKAAVYNPVAGAIHEPIARSQGVWRAVIRC
jgi:hypothetical protein